MQTQQRPESPTHTPGMQVNTRYKSYIWWSLCTLYLFACKVSYHSQLRSLLLVCVTSIEC